LGTIPDKGEQMSELKDIKKQSKAVTKIEQSIYEKVRSRKNLYEEVLPDPSSSGRFIQASLTAIKLSPKLQQCSTDSILKALMESARYGLEPNSPLSEAALIPYGDKVEFLIEYRGLLKLAWNSGLVMCIDFDKICEHDDWRYTKGDKGEFFHQPSFDDRGKVLAYYASAEIKGGGIARTVMSTKEILAHGKQFSKSFTSSSSPWQTDFDAMAIKTVLRQLIDKKLPKATTPQGSLLADAGHQEDIPEEVRHERIEVETEFESVE
jgi:recombination protein RecT